MYRHGCEAAKSSKVTIALFTRAEGFWTRAMLASSGSARGECQSSMGKSCEKRPISDMAIRLDISWLPGHFS
jgi:hypothetical protein